MNALTRHLWTCALNNAWANHRLLGACARLQPGELWAERTGFFPSIAATLNHVLTVDWYYVDALERSLAGVPVNAEARSVFDPEVPHPVLEGLAAAQQAVDARLIAVSRVEADPDFPIVILRRTGPVTERFVPILAHLFQHQIHHRGQAHAMLSGTSVPPPQLDEFFCPSDAGYRERDLAGLGWSEAEIWGT